METAPRSADTRFPIPEETKQAIRDVVLSKKWEGNGAMLDSFHAALGQHGFQPPRLGGLFDAFGDGLELAKVRLQEKDLFSILDNPIFNDMLAAARKKQVQTVAPLDVGGDQRLATKKAWRVPYAGSAPRLLKKAMDQMNTRRGLADYANFLPIIQSSGMGKSRTVDELARQVFTLPFNLRPASDDKGYPKGDLAILDWLAPRSLHASGVRMRYRIFFEETCKAVHEVLEKLPACDSQEKLADAFRSWLLKNRENFYRRIYDKLRAVPISNSASEESTSSNKSDSVGSPEWLAAQALIELIQRKSGVQPGDELAPREATDRGAFRPVWLHIYFDEAHSLTSETPAAEDGQMRTCYQILCSVINRFRALDLFAVFLSTNPKISTCSPPQPFWSSSRVRDEKTSGAQAPFCELPFDQWSGNRSLLSEGEYTLKNVCEPGFMVRFGRPLFWTRYECGDSGVKANLVSFARMKLAGQHNDQLDKTGQLAVLGVRIGLSFDRSRTEARQMENRLVEGHMRVVFSIPKHREYICADALSEPILAEAAAQLMHINKVWSYGLDMFFEWCNQGLIAKSERGELLARLLLTRAHDHAFSLGPNVGTLPMFTSPISLAEFLEALVGTENKDKIFNARPNNIPDGLTLGESALGRARLNFTHWAKAADSGVVTDEAAWIAMGRCLAWQCFDNQSEIDLVMPLILPSGDPKLERYTVSAIFWQIKNRKEAHRVDIDAERLKFFSPYSANHKTSSSVTAEYANSRPYLTVVLDLGVQIAEPATTKPEVAEPQAAKSRASKLRTSMSKSRTPKSRASKFKPYTSKPGATGRGAHESGTPEPGPSKLGATEQQVAQTKPNPSIVSPATRMSNRKGKPTHPRYSISILGCSHTTFPSLIATSEEHQYASLLSPRNYAAEHTRGDPEFQEAVAWMKPAWKTDEGAMGSFHQFTRLEPTRLGGASSPVQSTETIKIHEYAPNAGSGGEEAEDELEGVMDAHKDEGADGNEDMKVCEAESVDEDEGIDEDGDDDM